MSLNEFLVKLIDDDCLLKDYAFNENKNEIIELISNLKSKVAISISSSFFDENIDIFNEIPNRNYLQSIISLPIFKESSNVLLIVFNPKKKSNEFILIDESESMIHKTDFDDYLCISDDMINEISDSIKNFENSENAVSLEVDAIFNNSENDEDIQVQEDKGEYSEFLALKDPKKELVKRKKKVITDDIVDEFLNLKEEKYKRQEEERKKLLSLETFTVVSENNFINEVLYNKRRQNPENLLNKYGKPILDEKVDFRKLGKLADLKNIDEKNSKDTLLVGTCKHCNSKLVYYNHDIEDFEGEIYVEIDNVKDIVLKEYLYEYLNSGYGMEELLYFSKGHNYIRAHLIQSIKIPIPSIETQKEIVKASRDAREFFKTVDLLKKEYNSNILDYKHISDSINQLKGDIKFDVNTNEITNLSRSWRHAYQGLIWPLAISYLSATKGGFEIVEKKDNYLKLFEFIAAFNSIILLSGLPGDVYKNNFSKIWDAKSLKEYKQMTFANWVILSKNLGEVYRNNNFTSKLDEELFEKISSDKILDILFETKDYRNDEAHGSQSNAYEAKVIVDTLDKYLEDIFDILDTYSNYKLIYTTGDYKGTRQGYNHRVILLNGPCAQPIYDKIIFDEILSINSLYLYNPKNNKKLLIKDNFMRFLPVDENKKRWALFVYYKCDEKEFNSYYKCFQSKETDYKEQIRSLKSDILDYKE